MIKVKKEDVRFVEGEAVHAPTGITVKGADKEKMFEELKKKVESLEQMNE